MLGNNFRDPSFLLLVQPKIVQNTANNISNKRPLTFSKTHTAFLHPRLQSRPRNLHQMVTLPVIQIHPHRHLGLASDHCRVVKVFNLALTPHKLMLLKLLHTLTQPLHVPSRPPHLLQQSLRRRHVTRQPKSRSGTLQLLLSLNGFKVLRGSMLRHSIGRTVKSARLSALSGVVAATFASLFTGGGAF